MTLRRGNVGLVFFIAACDPVPGRVLTNEEKEADKKLTKLAEHINVVAAEVEEDG